jgi:glutamyl-tRNA synthetase
MSVEDFAQRLKPFFEVARLAPDDATLLKITPIIQERLATLDEAPEIAVSFSGHP